MSLRDPTLVACESVIPAFILFFLYQIYSELHFPRAHQIKLHFCLCWKLDSPSSPPPPPVTGFALYCREFSVSLVAFSLHLLL